MKKNKTQIKKTKTYNTFLSEIKEQIKISQTRAINSVNSEMMMLYYNIGKQIYLKKEQEGWGEKIIKQLSLDLKNELPKVKGFSERNIMFMLRFYKEYSEIEIVKQPVAQFHISLFYNIILIQKIKDKEPLR